MKKKVTKKLVKAIYQTQISASYCSIQTLLSLENPWAYTCGEYGWNADIYEIDGVAIVTGYRPFGTHQASYETCLKYEARAQEIRYNDPFKDYQELKGQLHQLAREFISEVLAQK